MMRLLLLLLLIPLASYAFEDKELDSLWSSIKDITQPTLEEWLTIEKYLKEGERSYLKPLEQLGRTSRIRGLKLVGPNNEMPTFEKVHLHPRKSTIHKRCILLYGSYNGIYPNKVRRLLAELDQIGYSGDVLVHIGGFPNMSHGGLKLCFVPYAFKVAFFKEAQHLGYEQALWLDTALHPLVNPEMIFSSIEKSGYFFTTMGYMSQTASSLYPEAAIELGVTQDFFSSIPHISSAIVGFNLKKPKVLKLLDEWLDATYRVYPCITQGWEETSLSILAWRFGFKPQSWVGNYICQEFELDDPLVRKRYPLPFYIDSQR